MEWRLLLVMFGLVLASFCSALGVAFFTLLERKVLGLGQFRMGPGKVSLVGLFQPFSDVLKLLSKVFVIPLKTSWFFLVFPFVSMSAMMVFWHGEGSGCLSSGSFLFFGLVIAFSSVGGLVLLFCGWVGGSVYSVLGGVRALVQFISYEVSSTFLWLFFLGGFCSFSVCVVSGAHLYLLAWFFLFLSLFFFGLVAELQRAPFDFAEGESELVSGFNVEYSSYVFSVIFLSEYGFLLFYGWVLGLLAVGGLIESVVLAGLAGCMIVVLRGAFPRFRFDLLQLTVWGILLPGGMVALVGLVLLLWPGSFEECGIAASEGVFPGLGAGKVLVLNICFGDGSVVFCSVELV